MSNFLPKTLLVYTIFTCGLLADSKIEVNGSLEKNLSLGQMALGIVTLSHELQTAPRGQSAWTCDFLTSYVVPEGRRGIQWVMLGGEIKRFKNRELQKSVPKQLKDEWTAVRGKTAGDVVFLHRKGMRFEYKEGQLREVSTPDG